MPSNTIPPRKLRVLFLVTSLPVGGAETLLASLVRGLDRRRFALEIACLKTPGPLGDELAREIPLHSGLLCSKWDVRVLVRLWRLLRRREIDVVVTVGAGDKMFWGRLAAWLARTPVVLSALHSTGWPDSVGRLNRLLTPLTDGFIGVAQAHAQHLIEGEGFPREKVFWIPNGVDTERFRPGDQAVARDRLNLPHDAAVVGILAALRPEKNHELFLQGAAQIRATLPNARFVVIGDGPRRAPLEQLAQELQIGDAVHFLGSRPDVAEILPALDLLALTSHNEASPVSLLEALSCSVPAVATNVGSVAETILPGKTGELFSAGDLDSFVAKSLALLQNKSATLALGKAGRKLVEEKYSLGSMIGGYEALLEKLVAAKTRTRQPSRSATAPRVVAKE